MTRAREDERVFGCICVRRTCVFSTHLALASNTPTAPQSHHCSRRCRNLPRTDLLHSSAEDSSLKVVQPATSYAQLSAFARLPPAVAIARHSLLVSSPSFAALVRRSCSPLLLLLSFSRIAHRSSLMAHTLVACIRHSFSMLATRRLPLAPSRALVALTPRPYAQAPLNTLSPRTRNDSTYTHLCAQSRNALPNFLKQTPSWLCQTNLTLALSHLSTPFLDSFNRCSVPIYSALYVL